MKISGFIFLFLSLHITHAQEYRPEIKERIKAVERNLSPAMRFEGDPGWTLKERMAHYNVHGVTIAIIKDYKIDWAKAYGYADSEKKTKVTTSTGFQAASISKTLNAVAFLKWIQENDVDLDQDINNLLTSWEFPYDDKTGGKKISPRNLLSHTAGLSVHGFPGEKNKDELPTTVQILNGKKPANTATVKSLFPPGEKFKYSGGGTTISELILKDQTKTPFEDYLKTNVFDPLDMTNSYYPRDVRSDVAKGHFNNGKQRSNGYNTYPQLGAAALWTTPTDLAKLIIELQLSLDGESEKVLTRKTVELMTTPYTEGQSNALGTFIQGFGDHTYFQHGGSNEGFKCQYYASTKDGHGIVIMVNSDQYDIISEIIRSAAAVYDWPLMAPKIGVEKVTISDHVMKEYVGTYTKTGDPNRSIKISLKKGVLMAEEKKVWSSKLVPQGKTNFIAEKITPSPTFTFLVEEGKLVVEQGVTSEWIKEK